MPENSSANDFNREASQSTPEWRSKKTLFKFIKSRLDENGAYMEDPEDEYYELEDLEELDPEKIDLLLHHLKQVALHGDEKSQYSFYQILAETDISESPNAAFIEAIIRENLPAAPYLFPFAKNLVFKTDKINVVKAGLHVLGACKNPSVLDDIKTMGSFEPLTLHVIAAIKGIVDNPVRDLWEFGRKQGHYGIMLVGKEFVHYPLTQEIKDWILYEGYAMNWIPADWAADFAMAGGLDEKLKSATIDYDLYKYARHYIECMTETEMKSDGMYDYAPAETTIINFLRHARQYAAEVSDYYCLYQLSEFLRFFGYIMNRKNKDANYAWTDVCREAIKDILYSRNWEELVLEALATTEYNAFYKVSKVADLLGIDRSDYLLRRIQNKPTNCIYWEDVVVNHKQKDVELLIQLAMDHLPWKNCAIGPAKSNDPFLDGRHAESMEAAISLLHAYPKKGEQIILYALESAFPRHRRKAISVLKSWERKNWSPEIRDAVEHLREIEPDEFTQTYLNLNLPDSKRR